MQRKLTGHWQLFWIRLHQGAYTMQEVAWCCRLLGCMHAHERRHSFTDTKVKDSQSKRYQDWQMYEYVAVEPAHDCMHAVNRKDKREFCCYEMFLNCGWVQPRPLWLRSLGLGPFSPRAKWPQPQGHVVQEGGSSQSEWEIIFVETVHAVGP